MEYKTLDPRTSEQLSADALNRLMAHLRAFYECQMKLSYLHELVDCAGDAEEACEKIRTAEELLAWALSNDVRFRLQEIDPTLADG
jgi:hypothetical protein